MTLNPDVRGPAVGRPAPIHLLDGPDYEHIEKRSRQHYASRHREGPEELAGALNDCAASHLRIEQNCSTIEK